ncbi:MAG: M15 family metallopeptidase [Patescibacteria group bacterium]
MELLPHRKFFFSLFQLLLAIVVTASIFVYGGYRYYLLNEDLTHARNQFETTSKDLSSIIGRLQENLASTTIQNRDLNDFVTILKARNSDFQNEIQDISLKVFTLEKLKNTDPELLQKYSKIYFLNENYIPSELSLITPDFAFIKTKPLQIHTRIRSYLEMLMRAANADGIDMSILSSYRSFGTQASLKSQYSVIYGSNSNKFSADQGYSEHQLGTTVDFTTKKIGGALTGFEKTPAYEWLLKNAYRFGFILSYPKGNSYYIFEPWHWRFVGVYLSTYLHEQNKNFYDLPKRDIDQYLIKIFD